MKYYKNIIWIETFQNLELSEKDSKISHPNYLNDESWENCYSRRKPIYDKLSSYNFIYPGVELELNQKDFWERVDKNFKNFIKRNFTGEKENTHIVNEDSFFLCTFLEDCQNLTKQDFHYININYNAVEIRVDCFIKEILKVSENISFLIESLKQKICFLRFFIEIPLIFTIRTVNEGGFFKENYKFYSSIIKNMLKTYFFDFYDIEYNEMNTLLINNLLKKSPKTRIILSKHFTNNFSCEQKIMEIFNRMLNISNDFKNISFIKIILNEKCSDKIYDKIQNKIKNISKTVLVFKLGERGIITRIKAKVFCPVSDQNLFKRITAPGQLNKKQIEKFRFDLNLSIPNKLFYVIGNSVKNSLSPKIHNILFNLSMESNCFYEFKEINDINLFENIFNSENFFGASITTPYKKQLQKFLNFEVIHFNSIIKILNEIIIKK